MNETMPRSWILVPVSKPEQIEQASRSGADAIVLDLVELIADKRAGRANVQAAIRTAKGGTAQVFVQIDPQSVDADLNACVWPGLDGVVMSRVESPEQIAHADAALSRLEHERGVARGTLKIVAAVETARGNHAAYDIARASPRVRALTLGRADLVMDLRAEPSHEIHLMP